MIKGHRFLGIIFCVAALLALTACGGLGNSPTQSNKFSASTPVVVATSPQYNVGTNWSIYVKFSHDMDPATINAGTVFIQGVSGSVSYDAPNRIASIHPATALRADTDYNATVTTGARNTSGSALPAQFSFSFHTRSTPDSSPPQVEPLPGCVPTAGPVQVKFDEPMDSSTINTSTFLVDGFTGTVSYDPITQIASFTPSTPFTAGATYTATITSGVKDLGGVSIQGNVDYDFVFTFTVCTGGTPGGFCTFTKGGYAGPGAPGQFFNANFSTVFANDLTIGIYDGNGPQHSSRWTAASPGPTALKTFLTSPALGASTALTGDFINPTATTSGELAEQVAALALNVGFSGTGSIPAGFGNLVLTGTGTSLDGASVSSILAIANEALAGNGLPSGFTFSTLNDLITNLNQSYDDCNQSGWAQQHLILQIG